MLLVLVHGGRITGDEIAVIAGAVLLLATLVSMSLRRDRGAPQPDPGDDDSSSRSSPLSPLSRVTRRSRASRTSQGSRRPW